MFQAAFSIKFTTQQRAPRRPYFMYGNEGVTGRSVNFMKTLREVADFGRNYVGSSSAYVDASSSSLRVATKICRCRGRNILEN